MPLQNSSSLALSHLLHCLCTRIEFSIFSYCVGYYDIVTIYVILMIILLDQNYYFHLCVCVCRCVIGPGLVSTSRFWKFCTIIRKRSRMLLKGYLHIVFNILYDTCISQPAFFLGMQQEFRKYRILTAFWESGIIRNPKSGEKLNPEHRHMMCW